MGRIDAIITDFDGTLVNTFMANYLAYKSVFKNHNIELSKSQYEECFGLRFDGLCDKMNVHKEIRDEIKKEKKEIYPKFFYLLMLNESLMRFIIYSKAIGIKTCIASTASKENLYNVLNHFGIKDYFDIIITGEDVKHGKPFPDVYNKALELLKVNRDEALIFEDSDTGCLAAYDAGINYIDVNKLKK